MNQFSEKKLINNLPRLKWACRRGMLELDVILGNFLEKIYPTLEEPEKLSFIKLLDQSDPELFAWLLGSAIPKDQELLAIVKRIRHAQHSL